LDTERLQMSFAAFFTTAFVSLNVLALAGGVVRLRGREHEADWSISLLLSTIGSLTGPLLLVDLGFRVLASRGVDPATVLQPSFTTLLLCWIWTIFLGPVFFLTALVHRAKATPVSVYLLQLGQLAAWFWSGLMLLAFI
jgi:hypothetical protein